MKRAEPAPSAHHVLVEVADLYQAWRMEHGAQMVEEAAKAFLVETREECDTLIASFYRAELATLAASDYARGVAVALAENRLAFAQFAAARACLEACALSRWLLDPASDNPTRLERICEVVRHDLDEGLKLANQSQLADAQVYFQERLENLNVAASKMGVRATQNAQGHPSGYGGRLNLTDLASSQLSAAHEYRLWSSIVHGASWALARAGLIEQDAPDTLFATPVVEIRRDGEAEDHLIIATLRCFAAAAIETVSVLGWDRDAFVTQIGAICDTYEIDVTNPASDQTTNVAQGS